METGGQGSFIFRRGKCPWVTLPFLMAFELDVIPEYCHEGWKKIK
jgi:hypothetical protein